MAEFTRRVIVLKRKDSGESDRVLTVLSLEEGKMDVIARGAKKPTYKFGGCTDPLTVATFGLGQTKKSVYLNQVQSMQPNWAFFRPNDLESEEHKPKDLGNWFMPW